MSYHRPRRRRKDRAGVRRALRVPFLDPGCDEPELGPAWDPHSLEHPPSGDAPLLQFVPLGVQPYHGRGGHR